MPIQKLWARLKAWGKQDQRILLTAGGVAGLVIVLRFFGVLQVWELATFDQLVRLRPPEGKEERILIVTVEEQDIQNSGQWPLPGRDLAELLEKINSAQPRAIGLDIYRDLPVEPGQEEFERVIRTLPNLIAIEKIPNDNSLGINPPPYLKEEDRVGFNNVVIDPDGKVRRNILYADVQGEVRFSLALKLALLYLEDEKIFTESASHNPEDLKLGQWEFHRFKSGDGAYARADDRGYQVIANFLDPQSFQKVTMAEVLAGEVPSSLMRDRIVLIGSNAPSVQDSFMIPYSGGWLADATPIAGVELHANFVSQILSAALSGRPFLQVLPEGVEWLWILAWSGVGAVTIAHWRSPFKASFFLLLAVSALSGTAYLSLILGWRIPLVPPLLALGGSAVIVTSYIAHQEEELKRSKDFLQSIINTIPDPIFVKDEQRDWLVLNQAYSEFIGYPIEKLLGQSEDKFFSPQEAGEFWAQEQRVFETKLPQENEEKFTNAKGMTHYIATKRSLHKDAAGNVFLVGVIRDITERKQVEEELRRTAAELTHSNDQLKSSENQLRYLAYHDDLTGLANRKKFQESLSQSLEWARIHEQLVGLLYIDLNGFKQVNDTLGHDIGDLLLKAVAKRLVNCLRSSDIVSRLGGDEFTIILPGIKKSTDIVAVIQKINETLSKSFMLEGHNIMVSASIGSSVYPDDGESQEILVKKADTKMFQVKERNRHTQP